MGQCSACRCFAYNRWSPSVSYQAQHPRVHVIDSAFGRHDRQPVGPVVEDADIERPVHARVGESIVLRDIDSFEFLAALEDAWKSERSSDVPATAVPFYGGWFLYLGYELAKAEAALKNNTLYEQDA